MDNICVIPKSVFGANQVSDPYHVTAHARDYDEIVMYFPETGDANLIAMTLNMIQVIGKPVWIIPNSHVDSTGLTSNLHRTKTLAKITASIQDIYEKLNAVGLITLLRGYAFDQLNFSNRWGDVSLYEPNSNGTPTNPRHLDRLFLNSCIAAVRLVNKAVMMISENISDPLSLVYSKDADVPGAAAWPAVLGTDSNLVDWIVVKNPVMSMQSEITNTLNMTPMGFAPHKLANISLAKAARKNTLKVGVLQQFPFYSMNPDFLLGQYVSHENKEILAGLSRILDFTAVDAWGFVPVTHPSVPMVVSKNLLKRENDATLYPATGSTVNMWSINGMLTMQYIVDDVLKKFYFRQDFTEIEIDESVAA